MRYYQEARVGILIKYIQAIFDRDLFAERLVLCSTNEKVEISQSKGGAAR